MATRPVSTRVVLLGASNIALAFPLIVRQLTVGLPGPLELFGAFGHGRSYCTWSRVLFRALPGIDRCGLWADLDRAAAEHPAPTLALITDIGNDLIYGSLPAVIAQRIEQCLIALAAHQAEIVITRLPLASVERLSALRYHATKAVFFPRTGVDWQQMRERACELDAMLVELATRFSARLVEQPLEWYGFDPIHIRRRQRTKAWQTVFAHWPSFRAGGKAPRGTVRETVRYLRMAPAERILFGRVHNAPQPAHSHGDITIRLY